MLIIEGQAGGNNHSNKGGGSNYLCLPNDPDNGKPYSYANDVLYGTEYETNGFGNLVTVYSINISSQCNVTAQIELAQNLIISCYFGQHIR
jgi:hypothetical protein